MGRCWLWPGDGYVVTVEDSDALEGLLTLSTEYGDDVVGL